MINGGHFLVGSGVMWRKQAGGSPCYKVLVSARHDVSQVLCIVFSRVDLRFHMSKSCETGF